MILERNLRGGKRSGGHSKYRRLGWFGVKMQLRLIRNAPAEESRPAHGVGGRLDLGKKRSAYFKKLFSIQTVF